MQRVNEWVFYDLAIRVHILTELPNKNNKYTEVWYTWWEARAAVDAIYTQRPLQFTTPVALRLYEAITDVVPKEWTDAVAKVQAVVPQPPQSEPDIPFWQVHEIREAAKEFETVLRTECHQLDTYFVSKKGAYSTKDLVENAHRHIPEPTRTKLDQKTRDDFDQAGKCIAFDVPTAAAFHLLRGTEVVIREYYKLIVPGVKQAPDKMRNWGAYIRLLNNHAGDKRVTALLLHMKDEYRNPVFHPEETYTDERVQVLFGLCISAVVVLKNAIDAHTTKSGVLAFPATGTTGAITKTAGTT